MRELRLGTIFLFTFLLAAGSACVTVPNTRVCTVAGKLSAGGICAETLTSRTWDLTLDQMIEFLEPQAERPDPDHPGEKLPPRSGALCQPSDDWNRQKTALEQACRDLGPNCSYEVKEALRNMLTLERLQGRGKQ